MVMVMTGVIVAARMGPVPVDITVVVMVGCRAERDVLRVIAIARAVPAPCIMVTVSDCK